MNNIHKDLDILPEGQSIPIRPTGRRLSPKIPISKGDWEFMTKRHFQGRFTILNRTFGPRNNRIPLSARLAAAMDEDKNICLVIAQKRINSISPEGGDDGR